MIQLHPFADDATSIEIGGLTIENGADCLALYGSLLDGSTVLNLDFAKGED